MSNAIPTAEPRNGVLLLSGYGVRVAVERGHPLIEAGLAEPEEVSAERVPAPVSDSARNGG